MVRSAVNSDGSVSDSAADGTLVVSGGCLALAQEDGTELTIVWPDELTTWDPRDGRVTLDRRFGDRFVGELGQNVRLGGAVADSNRGIDWVVAPASTCPSSLLLAG